MTSGGSVYVARAVGRRIRVAEERRTTYRSVHVPPPTSIRQEPCQSSRSIRSPSGAGFRANGSFDDSISAFSHELGITCGHVGDWIYSRRPQRQRDSCLSVEGKIADLAKPAWDGRGHPIKTNHQNTLGRAPLSYFYERPPNNRHLYIMQLCIVCNPSVFVTGGAPISDIVQRSTFTVFYFKAAGASLRFTY